MATCGTYDYSGDFAIRIGLPAKSGVGGGIVTASKAGYGIGVYCQDLIPTEILMWAQGCWNLFQRI